MCIFKMSIYNCIPSEYFFQKAKIFFRDTQVKNNHHKKIITNKLSIQGQLKKDFWGERGKTANLCKK